MTKQTQKLGRISKEEARKLCPLWFKYNEDWDGMSEEDFSNYYNLPEPKKRGQLCVVRETTFPDGGGMDHHYELVRVTSVGRDGIGEIKVRVSNGEYSWRTDNYALVQ